MDIQNLPFKDILVDGNQYPEPPKYIKDNPNVDLSFLYKGNESSKNPSTPKCMNVLENWIPNSETFLDESQSESLKTILSNRVALIRRPPCTVKTFIGIHTVRVLYNHLKKTQEHPKPIVVICYVSIQFRFDHW